MAQIRPRPRTRQVNPTTARVDGFEVTVDGNAVNSFDRATESSTSPIIESLRSQGGDVTVKDLRAQIGRDGLRQAAADAGSPRSERTLRRWVQQGRIPNARIAELAQRRALIARNGGATAVAAQIGASAATVSRFQSGRTNTLRGRPRFQLDALRQDDRLIRSGVYQPGSRATVRVTAAVEYRNHGNRSTDYRQTRSFDNLDQLDEQDSRDLAAAIAAGDNATSIAIIEKHLTLDWAQHMDSFDNDTGFHFTEITDIDITWDDQ